MVLSSFLLDYPCSPNQLAIWSARILLAPSCWSTNLLLLTGSRRPLRLLSQSSKEMVFISARHHVGSTPRVVVSSAVHSALGSMKPYSAVHESANIASICSLFTCNQVSGP